MKHNPLGKDLKIQYRYDPALLFPISRQQQRETLGIQNLNLKGADTWYAYEVSWLNPAGKPEVRILKITYPCESTHIVESKSLKLYLFSLSMTVFENEAGVLATIGKDLTRLLGTPAVELRFFTYQQPLPVSPIPDHLLLDHLPVRIDTYEPDADLLKKKERVAGQITAEHYSNLLKTNCPITQQPDWATIYIKYRAQEAIEEESLLKYIISFRNQADFHETCCEKILKDLYEFINPAALLVHCFYTRRGGIDINPLRFIGDNLSDVKDFHFWRQ